MCFPLGLFGYYKARKERRAKGRRNPSDPEIFGPTKTLIEKNQEKPLQKHEVQIPVDSDSESFSDPKHPDTRDAKAPLIKKSQAKESDSKRKRNWKGKKEKKHKKSEAKAPLFGLHEQEAIQQAQAVAAQPSPNKPPHEHDGKPIEKENNPKHAHKVEDSKPLPTHVFEPNPREEGGFKRRRESHSKKGITKETHVASHEHPKESPLRVDFPMTTVIETVAQPLPHVPAEKPPAKFVEQMPEANEHHTSPIEDSTLVERKPTDQPMTAAPVMHEEHSHHSHEKVHKQDTEHSHSREKVHKQGTEHSHSHSHSHEKVSHKKDEHRSHEKHHVDDKDHIHDVSHLSDTHDNNDHSHSHDKPPAKFIELMPEEGLVAKPSNTPETSMGPVHESKHSSSKIEDLNKTSHFKAPETRKEGSKSALSFETMPHDKPTTRQPSDSPMSRRIETFRV